MPMSRMLFAALLLLSIAGCGEQAPATAASGTAPSATAAANTHQRWYDAARVERGEKVYAETCAACHGKYAQGDFSWRKRSADGKFPPPPLNGTGHAWHHPFAVLASQIKFGAPGGQGSMPALGDALTDEQIIDVVAWMQSHWNDEIYASWAERDGQYRAQQRQ